jgi:predicted nucleotide-binding protein
MEKSRRYDYTKFPPEVLREGRLALASDASKKPNPTMFLVYIGRDVWHFDTEEEFFAEYRRQDACQASYLVSFDRGSLHVLFFPSGATDVGVTGTGRSEIERVFEIFEAAAPNCKLPKEEREAEPRKSSAIFVGHGQSSQWRDLKDHLHEKHGFRVEAYETGARAGFTIADILQRLAEEAGFALLVLTGDDVDPSGQLHARENVIHEAGLFQGKLGFARAIVLLEQDCNEFSNIAGLQQVRFAKGNIKEAFGEVLATIRREFELD